MSDEPDRVAWVLVERGWKVVDAQGEKVGKVDEVSDIFHGLIVDGEEIDADRIGEIREGEIRLL